MIPTSSKSRSRTAEPRSRAHEPRYARSLKVQHAMSLIRWWLDLLDAVPRSPLREDSLPEDELLAEHPGTP